MMGRLKVLILLVLLIGPPLKAQPEFPVEFPRIRWSPNPLYVSEGFRLGFVLRITHENILVWTYEGQLMQGFGTDQGMMFDNECYAAVAESYRSLPTNERGAALERAMRNCLITANPWPFSFFEEHFYRQFRSMPYGPTVIYYQRPWMSPWNVYTKSKNFVKGLWPVDEKLPVGPSPYTPEELHPITHWANPESGFFQGRVVKASLDNWLLKSYEIIIQQGGYGNNFRAMTVSDPRLFDHIVKCMLTGRLLSFEFIRYFPIQAAVSRLFGAHTAYRITKVSVAEENLPTPLPTARPPAPTTPPEIDSAIDSDRLEF